MTLFDEGTYDGVTSTSWQNGINLSACAKERKTIEVWHTYTKSTPLALCCPCLAPAAFVGARGYASDSFTCTAFDPTTGVAVTRSVNIYIGCNQAGKTTDPLNVIGYTEEGQCTYYIKTSHKLGCGVLGNPFDINLLSESDIPTNFTPTRNWWFTCLGTFLMAPIIYIIYSYMDYKGYCDRVKYAIPSVATSWMPSWLFSSGGGGSSSGGSYSASYKAVGTAGGSSTPISSAYGSA